MRNLLHISTLSKNSVTIIISICSTLIILLISHTLIVPRFTIDDIILNMVIKGVGLGIEPQPFLYLGKINIIPGLILSELYNMSQGFPFYYIMHAFFHFTASVVICYHLIIWNESKSKFWPYCFVAVFLLTADLFFYFFFRFSFTAMLCMSAALCVLLEIIRQGSWHSSRVLLLILLVTLSGMMRREVSYYVLLIALPFIACQAFRLLNSGSFTLRNKRLGLFATVLGLLFLIVLSIEVPHAFSTHYYSKSGWSDYRAFNSEKWQ